MLNEKRIVGIDLDELAHDILYNVGNYQFVMSNQGELFDCSSTARAGDLSLALPIVPQATSLDDKNSVALSLANEFLLTLNLPSAWQGQAVNGKPITDIFEFIEIPF